MEFVEVKCFEWDGLVAGDPKIVDINPDHVQCFITAKGVTEIHLVSGEVLKTTQSRASLLEKFERIGYENHISLRLN